MKSFLLILLGAFLALSTARAGNYSTEVTMTPQKETGTYEVEVQVAELVEQDGKTVEKPIGQPKLKSPFGSPSSIRIGPERGSSNYKQGVNVTLDVSWPKVGEAGAALCTVTIRMGDTVVSRSTTRFKLENK